MSTVETDETADERRRRKKKEHDKQYLVANREKILEGKRAWRIANPDKVRNQGREWAMKNPDKVKLKREKYNTKNADKNLERSRAYRAANREKVRKSTRKWCATNTEKVRQAHAKESEMRRPRLMILAPGRWGKDTAAEYLRDKYGLTFRSSSEFVGRKAVFPHCQPKATQEFTGHPEYETFEECFADRHNHRALWHDLISKYNRDDAARLGRELFAEYDMYVGLRSRREFDALKAEKAFDHVIWIDASKRHPPESSASMSIDVSVADHIIDNNGTLADLHRNLDRLMERLDVSILTEIDTQCK